MIQRRVLYSVYWRLEKLLAPGLQYCQHEYEAFLGRSVPRGCRWLDLGCGHQLLPSWRREGERALVSRAGLIVGVDPEIAALRKHATISARAAGDASSLPFASETFDIVTANQVVEHLSRPVDQFKEIRRVLRPGGLFVFLTPNRHGHYSVIARMMPERLKSIGVRLLEGRAEEDRFKTHYRANSKREIHAIAEQSGFRVASLEFVPSTAMFAVVAPLAALELLWIRITMKWLPELRSNLIVALERC